MEPTPVSETSVYLNYLTRLSARESSGGDISVLLSENVTVTVSVDITLNAHNKQVENAVRGNCAINSFNGLTSRHFGMV